MVDCVPLLEEETVEGMESHEAHDHDHEAEDLGLGEVVGYDEHVWTSPKNAAAITRAVGDKMAELDGANAAVYSANAEAYAVQIEALDQAFTDFFAEVEDRTMVFGDRFPLRYFAEEFGINYYAAFPGCSTQTEPSAATIAFLTDKVRQEQIPTVWYIEFSNHLVADSIAEAMSGSLSSVTTAQITYAARDSDFDGFAIHEGDYLALEEGKLFGTDTSIDTLLEKLAGEASTRSAEFVSLYFGEDVTEDDAQRAAEIFQSRCPDAEVAVLSGGQPVYYYIISIE